MNAMQVKCALCDRDDAVAHTTPGPINRWRCPTCGDVLMTMSAIEDLRGRGVDIKKTQLSALTRERTISGRTPLCIRGDHQEIQTSEANTIGISEFLKRFPNDFNSRIKRTLLNLAHIQPLPGVAVLIDFSTDVPVIFAESDEGCWRLLCWYVQAGYLEWDIKRTVMPKIAISPKGFELVSEAKAASSLEEKKQVFIAMWFDPSMEEAFENGLKPGVEDGTDFNAVRIDFQEFLGDVHDEIIVEIKKSRALVVDLTKNRPNVYFEAGFAEGLGIPVIYTMKRIPDDERPHFDVRQRNTITWDDAEELRHKLNNRIKATIV